MHFFVCFACISLFIFSANNPKLNPQAESFENNIIDQPSKDQMKITRGNLKVIELLVHYL